MANLLRHSKQIERFVSLCLTLKSRTRRGKSTIRSELREWPGYKEAPSADAFKKKWERDKKLLEALGQGIEQVYEEYEQVSWILTPRKLIKPQIQENTGSTSSLVIAWRCLRLLEMAPKQPTVSEVAEDLECTKQTVRRLLDYLLLAGREPWYPHDYLDPRVEDGRIVITGPRYWE